MDMSPTIASIAEAMSKAQAKVEGAVKGKANPAFKGSKYADLQSVWDACREALTGNGIAVVQFPGDCVDGRVFMTTILTHSSGEWMRETLSIPLGKVDAQGYGSAITYARRYALAAIAGVSPEDDDGNAASRPHNGNDGHSSGPAPREKLEGKHSSKTALRGAINAAIIKVRKAETKAELAAIGKEYADDIAQAQEAWPSLLTGEPGIDEDIGLTGAVKKRQAELSDTGMLGELIHSMKNCVTLLDLGDWLDVNRPLVDALSDGDSRKFQKSYDEFDAGLVAIGRTNAG